MGVSGPRTTGVAGRLARFPAATTCKSRARLVDTGAARPLLRSRHDCERCSRLDGGFAAIGWPRNNASATAAPDSCGRRYDYLSRPLGAHPAGQTDHAGHLLDLFLNPMPGPIGVATGQGWRE